MGYSINFLKVIPKHIMAEGGWVKNELDPGKETYKGIARTYNGGWMGWVRIDEAKTKPNFPASLEQDSILRDQVYQLYYTQYWQRMQLDLINKLPVVEELFDQGAGPDGITVAIKIVQGALVLLKRDVKVDGVMGPKTAEVINSYPGVEDLVGMMNCLQFTHLLVGSNNVDEIIQMARDRLPQLKEFMRGWLRRITV